MQKTQDQGQRDSEECRVLSVRENHQITRMHRYLNFSKPTQIVTKKEGVSALLPFKQ